MLDSEAITPTPTSSGDLSINMTRVHRRNYKLDECTKLRDTQKTAL